MVAAGVVAGVAGVAGVGDEAERERPEGGEQVRRPGRGGWK